MISPTNPTILYGSPDGYDKVVEFYDKTLDNMGIKYQADYIETSFGLTHIISCGKKEGKPIILWHGQNANSATWASWMPALAKDFRVYAVDTIGGLGKSAPTRLKRKGSGYGDWAAEVLTGINVKHGNMIGASNGGWMILKLAGVAPQLIGSAVLLSSAGFKSISVKLVFQMISRSLSKDTRVIAENLVELLSPPELLIDPYYLDFFELILKSKFKGESITPRLTDREIRELTAPTCLLMGEYERSFNPYLALNERERLLPELAVGEIVPGVGHSMQHKDPNWVISRVTKFLDEYAVNNA